MVLSVLTETVDAALLGNIHDDDIHDDDVHTEQSHDKAVVYWSVSLFGSSSYL